jgi:two-component system, NtrC family, nitrogen regulation response regulator NtrX
MKKYTILVADDQKNACDGIKEALDQKRFDVDIANNLSQAMALWDERQHDIVVSDLRMPADMEGLELLQYIRSKSQSTVVILMTAFGDIETAVQAMRLGAFDFFSKPFTADEIEIKIENALKTISLVAANRSLCQTIDNEYKFIGDSEKMNELKRRIALVAKGDVSTLIFGPHGTGKEIAAWAIQQASPRKDKPFVRVNCAAIAETLVEAELFGSEKGAFTSSNERKIGKFQQADHGTLFLDEVGDMSPNMQAKLLRVLESGEISPVGGTKPIFVDVRIIAATNKNLLQLIQNGQFREDLFFRLNGVSITTPSLAEHCEDIPALVTHFMRQMGNSSNVNKVFSDEALAALKSWKWPGNVRELKNVVERVVLFCEHKTIGADEIEKNISSVIPEKRNKFDLTKNLKDAREDFEREFISMVLKECKTVTDAAKRLGLQRSYLHQKMNELGIKE